MIYCETAIVISISFCVMYQHTQILKHWWLPPAYSMCVYVPVCLSRCFMPAWLPPLQKHTSFKDTDAPWQATEQTPAPPPHNTHMCTHSISPLHPSIHSLPPSPTERGLKHLSQNSTAALKREKARKRKKQEDKKKKKKNNDFCSCYYLDRLFCVFSATVSVSSADLRPYQPCRSAVISQEFFL